MSLCGFHDDKTGAWLPLHRFTPDGLKRIRCMDCKAGVNALRGAPAVVRSPELAARLDALPEAVDISSLGDHYTLAELRAYLRTHYSAWLVAWLPARAPCSG